MKKLIALLLCLVMALSLVACGSKQDDTQAPADDQQGAEETSLVDAAKAEGKLVVYGSCEEEYLAAACQNFEKTYGIKVEYQRLSTGEVQAKIERHPLRRRLVRRHDRSLQRLRGRGSARGLSGGERLSHRQAPVQER